MYGYFETKKKLVSEHDMLRCRVYLPMNINYTAKHLLRAVWITSGIESYSLTNLHLARKIMGRL
jgi:hypothetical protein